MTREKALELLEEPLYDENEMRKDIDFILKQIDLSWEEFEQIMNQSLKQHTDYRTSRYNALKVIIIKILKFIMKRS